MASKTDLKSDSTQIDRSFDKHAVLQSLQELQGFKANWDGYGAAPLEPQNLQAARRFIESLPDSGPTQPMVVPMTRGRVQLEWHRGNRSLELEFASPSTVHFLQWDSDRGVETEDVVSAERTDLLKGLLNWFMAE